MTGRNKLITVTAITATLFITGCALRPALSDTTSKGNETTASTKTIISTDTTKAETKTATATKSEPVTKPGTNPGTKPDNNTKPAETVTKPATTAAKTEPEKSDPDGLVFTPTEVRQMMFERSDKKLVFLTFDDGPSNNNTPKILKTLRDNGINATFFYYTKDNMGRLSDVIKETYKDGNSIGVHSNTHEYSQLYPGRQADVSAIVEDAKNALQKIKGVLGENWNTKVYRFPGGSFSWGNSDAAKEKLKSIGLDYIDWNTMTGDSDDRNHDKSPEGLLKFLKDANDNVGSKVHVVLMHDGSWVHGVSDGLQSVIDYYKDLGYRFGIIR